MWVCGGRPYARGIVRCVARSWGLQANPWAHQPRPRQAPTFLLAELGFLEAVPVSLTFLLAVLGFLGAIRPRLTHLPIGGVRFLGGGGVHAQADAALAGVALQCTVLGLARLTGSALAPPS